MNDIISEISHRDLQESSAPQSASITDVVHLSSYNWIESPVPSIVVPGSPPLWSPPKGPCRVKKDSGLIYIGQNAARHPSSPLEPLFRAVYMTNPSFDIRSVDVVTDRNVIRKLLSFVSSGSSTKELEPFTFRIEFTKDTAIFCREDTDTHQLVGPDDFVGFGHEFEKAYTASQIEGSTGHHRIVSYRFTDLNSVVRHETDGFVGAGAKTPFSSAELSENDRLSNLLGSLSLSSIGDRPGAAAVGSRLTIKEGGRTVPLDSTIEIKTRTFSKRLQIHEVAPQLWVSQTPKLVRAYHNRGTFQEPEVEDIAGNIKKWEEANQSDLRKLAGLIKKILAVVKEVGGNATVRYDGGQKLVVRKAIENKMLPNDLYSKWDVGGYSQAETNTVRHAAASKASQKKSINQGETMEDYNNIRFGNLINEGVKSGLRQFFRLMPLELSEYHALCKDLEALEIDITEGRCISGIIHDMRRGKSDWDPEERREIGGLKRLARDSAFRLLFMFLCEKFRSGLDSNMAYNGTLFVVSHRRVFRYRTRRMVREAFLEQFHVSEKQKRSLNQWPVEEASAGLQEDDQTTEEEWLDYDSDFSF